MITFEYNAKNDQGASVKGLVEAETESAAAKLLAAQKLSPIDIKIKSKSNNLFAKITDRIRAKDKVLFTRQLSTLINAGLPLTQSLRTVSEQTNSKTFAVIINQVISSVEGGTSFSES